MFGQQPGQQRRLEHRRGQRQRHVVVTRGGVGRTGDPFDDNGGAVGDVGVGDDAGVHRGGEDPDGFRARTDPQPRSAARTDRPQA